MKVCTRCSTSGPLTAFYPDRSKRDGHHTICKECVKADRRARYEANPALFQARHKDWYDRKGRAWQVENGRKLRARVLAAYGGACRCCGETTPEFLSIDHIFNDGEAHRRELAGYGRAIYKWLEKQGYPKDRFQLLCHNCNMAKGLYGACPHALVPA